MATSDVNAQTSLPELLDELGSGDGSGTPVDHNLAGGTVSHDHGIEN